MRTHLRCLPAQVRYIQYLVCERLDSGDGLPVRGSKVRKEKAEGGRACLARDAQESSANAIKANVAKKWRGM